MMKNIFVIFIVVIVSFVLLCSSFSVVSSYVGEYNYVIGGDIEDLVAYGDWIKNGVDYVSGVYCDSSDHSIGFDSVTGISVNISLVVPILVTDINHFTFNYFLEVSQLESIDQYFNMTVYFSDNSIYNGVTYIGFGAWTNGSCWLADPAMPQDKYISAVMFEAWTLNGMSSVRTLGFPSDVKGWIDDIYISSTIPYPNAPTPTPSPTITPSPTPVVPTSYGTAVPLPYMIVLVLFGLISMVVGLWKMMEGHENLGVGILLGICGLFIMLIVLFGFGMFG